MMARRCGSGMALQAVISAGVRPQPMQSFDRGSTTQICTQGLEGAPGAGSRLMAVYLGRAMADEKADEAGDFGHLLRRAGDIAGLAADLAARQSDHRQSGG